MTPERTDGIIRSLNFGAPLTSLLVLPVLLCLSSPASAVEVTDMPDALRGDVTLNYEGQFGRRNLVQDGASVGQQKLIDHVLRVHLEFAPVNGVSVYATIPTTLSRTLSFPQAYEMMLDPATGEGHYITESALEDPPEYKGSGGQGTWFGVGLAPYAERFNASHQLTWRLDLAARTRPKITFWAF